MKAHSASQCRQGGFAILALTILIGCSSDPIAPERDHAVMTQASLSAKSAKPGKSERDSIDRLIGVSTRTSPWYVGWTTTETDSAGNITKIVGIKPTTAVPVKTIFTYWNGVLRERMTLLWEPVAGGWELVRLSSSFHRQDGSLHATSIASPEELGLTSFLSSTCITYSSSATGCFSGVLQSSAGFAALVLAVPITAAAEVPTGGLSGAAWIAGWVGWTGLLIDTVEACSASSGGSTANERPRKRLT